MKTILLFFQDISPQTLSIVWYMLKVLIFGRHERAEILQFIIGIYHNSATRRERMTSVIKKQTSIKKTQYTGITDSAARLDISSVIGNDLSKLIGVCGKECLVAGFESDNGQSCFVRITAYNGAAAIENASATVYVVHTN